MKSKARQNRKNIEAKRMSDLIEAGDISSDKGTVRMDSLRKVEELVRMKEENEVTFMGKKYVMPIWVNCNPIQELLNSLSLDSNSSYKNLCSLVSKLNLEFSVPLLGAVDRYVNEVLHYDKVPQDKREAAFCHVVKDLYLYREMKNDIFKYMLRSGMPSSILDILREHT